jgi:hypothetical protein
MWKKGDKGWKWSGICFTGVVSNCGGIVMQRNISWNGMKYQSIEHCSIREESVQIVIDGNIMGESDGRAFNASYSIRVDRNWGVQYARVDIAVKGLGLENLLELERSEDRWLVNEQYDERFGDCRDIDISLTPFTNTIPIRRLELQDGECREIEVIYIDVLEKKVKSMKQSYMRVSEGKYVYKNTDGSFRAELLTDGDGMIVSYPGLFRMEHMGMI